ncbi:hypothetical protein NDU88_010415 [Pleurodeles waltl]|uniref:Uncharacterized protein n=1 Tax=Pleurodeles waltl TaxID=8319 RepID=A0AAV7S382_PLEWA|nr:hypothetical protein NDU88_010415 [Pleurodeles waltl]
MVLDARKPEEPISYGFAASFKNSDGALFIRLLDTVQEVVNLNCTLNVGVVDAVCHVIKAWFGLKRVMLDCSTG